MPTRALSGLNDTIGASHPLVVVIVRSQFFEHFLTTKFQQSKS